MKQCVSCCTANDPRARKCAACGKAFPRNKPKAKGDNAEREVQALLRKLLGVPARRALGAGRKDDVGDIGNVPDTVIQVAAWDDLARCVREKLPTVAAQMKNAQAKHGALFIRRRGGQFIVVQTPEQWAEAWRAGRKAA